MSDPTATKESAVDAALRIAREVHPDVYQRSEAVARIIDPAAFMEDWVCHPESSAELHRARLCVQQANALGKAHEVLTYFGVNTQTDWFTILERMAAERSGEA